MCGSTIGGGGGVVKNLLGFLGHIPLGQSERVVQFLEKAPGQTELQLWQPRMVTGRVGGLATASSHTSGRRGNRPWHAPTE